MPLITARLAYDITTGEQLRTWLGAHAKRALAAEGLRQDDVPALSELAAAAPPAIVYANEGRWLADCPAEGCGGSQIVLERAPYWCPYCLNADIGRRWRVVMWPEQREAIEGALMARPRPLNRNWWPGESVDALRVENIANGIGGQP